MIIAAKDAKNIQIGLPSHIKVKVNTPTVVNLFFVLWNLGLSQVFKRLLKSLLSNFNVI
jgi:hypothetical protein